MGYSFCRNVTVLWNSVLEGRGGPDHPPRRVFSWTLTILLGGGWPQLTDHLSETPNPSGFEGPRSDAASPEPKTLHLGSVSWRNQCQNSRT